MLPFRVEFAAGLPVYEQVVYAVKKAVASGALKAGDRFPSVRALSQELRINPNTAHKVVGALVGEGILEVHPGIGTVVAPPRAANRQQRGELLGPQLERLVVEARNLGLEFNELGAALLRHWKKF